MQYLSLKIWCTQDDCIDSLSTLHMNKELNCSQNQPHIVPTSEHLDFTLFQNVEALHDISYYFDTLEEVEHRSLQNEVIDAEII
jgi:hypothetical protein